MEKINLNKIINKEKTKLANNINILEVLIDSRQQMIDRFLRAKLITNLTANFKERIKMEINKI